MQFKMEAQIIKRHPECMMDNRLLLDKIDYEKGTITIKGEEYPLRDTNFPTIDPKNPFELSEEEQSVMDKIKSSFVNSGKLQRHVRFMFSNGCIYSVFNSNLLFHGCIPMNEDGSLKEVLFRGKRLKGKDYMDAVERAMREGYYTRPHSEGQRENALTLYGTFGAERIRRCSARTP